MSCVLAGTEILFPIWILHHVSRSELSENAALCFGVSSASFFGSSKITQVNLFSVNAYVRSVCRISTDKVVTFFTFYVCFILTVSTHTYIPRLIVAFVLICVIKNSFTGVFSIYPSADYSMGPVSLGFYRQLDVTTRSSGTSDSIWFTC